MSEYSLRGRPGYNVQAIYTDPAYKHETSGVTAGSGAQ